MTRRSAILKYRMRLDIIRIILTGYLKKAREQRSIKPFYWKKYEWRSVCSKKPTCRSVQWRLRLDLRIERNFVQFLKSIQVVLQRSIENKFMEESENFDRTENNRGVISCLRDGSSLVLNFFDDSIQDTSHSLPKRSIFEWPSSAFSS